MLLNPIYKKRKFARDALKHPWLSNAFKVYRTSKVVLERAIKNMKCFKVNSKLMQITVMYLVHSNLGEHPEETKELYHMFMEMDENRTG